MLSGVGNRASNRWLRRVRVVPRRPGPGGFPLRGLRWLILQLLLISEGLLEPLVGKIASNLLEVGSHRQF